MQPALLSTKMKLLVLWLSRQKQNHSLLVYFCGSTITFGWNQKYPFIDRSLKSSIIQQTDSSLKKCNRRRNIKTGTSSPHCKGNFDLSQNVNILWAFFAICQKLQVWIPHSVTQSLTIPNNPSLGALVFRPFLLRAYNFHH